MRIVRLIIAVLACIIFNRIDLIAQSVSLEAYCPKKNGQYLSTCFAYAPVYTALSIMHNVRAGADDESKANFKVLSDGFVASKVKQEKGFFGRMFNKCGRYATVDLALGVLLKTGTVLKSDFPDGCATGEISKHIESAKTYRIKDTVLLGDEKIASVKHIEAIKSSLRDRSPVIIALFQEDFFHNNTKYELNFPDNYAGHTQNANHVICIVGFDEERMGGAFLVKNNYPNWGKHGFAYVRYEDMMKLIRYSYRMVI